MVMLTKADIKWLDHLSNSKKVKIVPYNPKLEGIFEKQKKEILDILGQNIEVLHRGASGMGFKNNSYRYSFWETIESPSIKLKCFRFPVINVNLFSKAVAAISASKNLSPFDK